MLARGVYVAVGVAAAASMCSMGTPGDVWLDTDGPHSGPVL
jgi:hypothetical protein